MPSPVLKTGAKILDKLNIRGSNYLKRAASGVSDWYFTNAYASAFSVDERAKLLKNCPQNIPSPQEIVKKHTAQAEKDGNDECAKMQYIDLNY